MPRSFPNPYAYESPIGQGLQNIAQMLLRDDGGAKAAMNAAHMQTYRAQADKLRADAEQTAYQTDQSRNFLNNAARNLLGDTGQQGLRFIQGATDFVPAREDEARQMTMAPTTAPVQRPANMDANAERTLRQLAVLATAAAPNSGMNMDNLAKSISEMNKGSAYHGVLDGSVDPSRYMIASEKPLYHFGETYAGNVATGEQRQNELGKAKVGTERAHQGAYGAQANASNANARQSNRTNLLVDIPSPLDPTKTIQVPASELYRQTNENQRTKDTIAGRKNIAELRNADGTPQKIIKATKDDRNALGQALSAWIVTDTGYPIAEDDPALPQLMEEALSSYTNPGNPGYLNPQAATRLAIDKFGAKGTQDWNLIGANKTKLSIVPPSQRVEAHGAPATAPAAAKGAAPEAAVEMLRKNPSLAPAFQQKYGYLP